MSTRNLRWIVPLIGVVALSSLIGFRAQARVAMSNPDPELGARLRTCLGLDPACVAAMGGNAETFGLIVAATDQFAGDHTLSISQLVADVEHARHSQLLALETYDDLEHENDGELTLLESQLESKSVLLRAECAELANTLALSVPGPIWNRCVGSQTTRRLDPRCGMLSLQLNQIEELKEALRARDRVISHHSRRAHMRGVKEAWDRFNEDVADILTVEQEAQWSAAESQLQNHLATLITNENP